MTRKRHWAAGVGVCLALAAATAPAHAEGFALNRFNPSERGSRWFSADSLPLSENLPGALGIVADWAHEPLVAYDENGDKISALVEDQVFLHVGGSLVLADRLRLALSAPILVHQSGSSVLLDGEAFIAPDGAAFGDLRVSADVRLLGRHDEPFTLAVGVAAFMPTGSRDAYTGDGSFRLIPRLQAAGELGMFVYAANAGVHVRADDRDFADEPVGTELLLGGAAGLQFFDRRVLVGPEIWASSVVSDGPGAFLSRTGTPFEAQLGAHFDVAREVRLGVGVGPGLSRGLGAPAMRWVLSAEWVPVVDTPPPAPPSDRDGDGVVDGVDACPDVPGVRSPDPALDGCPVRADTDRDGIFDPEDACVEEPGPANPSDPSKHGCPLPDRDGDGILDAEDACPDEAGPANSNEPDKHGCPVPADTDGDGIPDAQDACPKEPGPASSDPAKHGCPKAVVTGESIRILDRIEFDTGKATIRPESDEVLSAVLKILQEHPEIGRVSVEGHTDNRGSAQLNRRLSRERAAAVVKWLVERGVSAERLAAAGFGPDKPLDTNDTEAGRQNNRRVEFQILERSKPNEAP